MTKKQEVAKLNWHDYWKIAVRRRWFLLGPLFALGLLGCVGSLIWPTRFRSEALIMVDPQKVAEQLVTPNVVVNLDDRLQSMTQQILSRSRLAHLIDQFNLYASARKDMSQSEVVDMMRKDITIEPVKGATKTGDLMAFRIAYLAPDRQVAQQVVRELTSLFIYGNVRSREQQSSDTTSFLETQLAEARQNLDEKEQRLREYKMQYLGELPEQQQSNLQILSSLEAQLNSASTELDRLAQDKTYLESMAAGYKTLAPPESSVQYVDGHPQPDALAELRAKLSDLQAKYTDRYPEVIRTKQEIARLEAQEKLHPKSAAAPLAPKISGAGADPGNTQGLIEIDSRLKAVNVDMGNREQEVNSLRRKIQTVQAQLNVTPVREQQLAEVSRDYETAKAQYQSLQQKESQSALATNLEKRQQSDEFRIIDPPSLPEKPVEPNRAEISLGGWVLGLMAGIGLVMLKEITDTRVYGEEQIRNVSDLPILATVPDLVTMGKAAIVHRRQWMEALTVSLLVATSLGFGAYLYYWVK